MTERTYRITQSTSISAGFVAVIVCAGALVGPAHALKPLENEEKRLHTCEMDLCNLLVNKAPEKGVMRCNVGKTWIKKDIKKGADKKKLSWTSGDAQCSVKLRLDRRAVVSALTSSEFEIRVKRHYVNCIVEGKSGADKVYVSLAPKLKFKDGKVNKIWLNIKEVKGPPGIKSLIWAAATLEDGLGIFHGEMVEETNEFIYKKCGKRLKAEAKKARKAAKAKREAKKAAKRAERDKDKSRASAQ